ncbi:hypothetical protein IRP63_15850 (plasmid) [Clostridium botulinum]|uniref:Peptidase S1 domain-containing protein n=1 Tax=Clostridium botulinum C/D str. DC5 TaxID=1443128 RepID=A0A0A0HY57_CLOBO|nr:hypothetical protein [Clostridium botulinum]KEH99930.1 hypothetical protein Z952_14815 [Clostridium botulinum C/D str. BKT75002]KEI05560.1 hypothetical protein Z954_15005 [Clostridium botulinum C/D str. BKT2873]KGM93006.1 hypothetical protein Z955_16240 [Clostridium botulinum C/D str. DC5]KOC51400.1 hypothetical protein ADU89_13630 [Clostridium botulinum]KOC52058.1 hypothetical protein ADU90_14880 [Clostridium botulinum]
MYNSCTLEEKILYISKCEYQYFLNKRNVVGVGFGNKIKNGFDTGEKCITVFVTHKLPANEIPMKDLIPAIYKNIQTDVIECGIITPSSLTNKIRPIPGGYAISTPTKLGGTLGCFATDESNTYLLTCNHVIAINGDIRLFTPILQPSFNFGGTAPKDAVANLSKYIKVNEGTENKVDCAIAQVTDLHNISKNIAIINKPLRGIVDAKIGMRVQKIGYITERTLGKITVIGSTFNLTMWGKSYKFVDQIWTTKMDDKGDSGSILIDQFMNAVGLLMSSSTKGTQYNPIKNVLSSLNIELLK